MNLGGTRSRMKNKIVGIIGMENQVIYLELVVSSMVSDIEFNAPSLEAYREYKTAEEIRFLIPDGGGAFEGSSAFIMAPLLRTVVL